jgi:hypothetical protein
LYSSDIKIPRLKQNQIEVSGYWTPSYQHYIILYVDKPDAGCETLPDTISVRIMIVSFAGWAYDVLEADSGNTVRQERGGLFDLCNGSADNLTGIVVKTGKHEKGDAEFSLWTPDIGNDFGEPWE